MLRGVPLQADGYFFLPLWTNWQPGAHPGILDWYTVIGGLVALVALTLHGALWLTIKTSGDLEQRARNGHAAVADACGPHHRQPVRHHRRAPGEPGQLLPLSIHLHCAGGRGRVAGRNLVLEPESAAGESFLASCFYLFFMLAGACWGVYPVLLPATTGADNDITLSRAITGPHTLAVGLVWWIFGMALAVGYVVFVYSRFKGKVTRRRDVVRLTEAAKVTRNALNIYAFCVSSTRKSPMSRFTVNRSPRMHCA